MIGKTLGNCNEIRNQDAGCSPLPDAGGRWSSFAPRKKNSFAERKATLILNVGLRRESQHAGRPARIRTAAENGGISNSVVDRDVQALTTEIGPVAHQHKRIEESRAVQPTTMADRPTALAVSAAVTLTLFSLGPGHTEEPARDLSLTRGQASAFARLALKGLSKEYPNKPEHVLAGPADVKAPRALHPAFLRVLRLAFLGARPLDARAAARGVSRICPKRRRSGRCSGQHLTAENFKVEADYFARKESKSFERPYGWAWLLKLAEELNGWDDPDAKAWAKNLQPLADVIVVRYLEFFPKQTYPIRTGVHPNTAFGLSFAHDYARAVGDMRACRSWSRTGRGAYFGQRRRCPGRVGAGRGRLLLAELDRGRPDAAGAVAGRVPGLVRTVLAGGGQGRAEGAFQAGDGDRPDRPATRPPRRTEPEPGLVHEEHRGGACRTATRLGPRSCIVGGPARRRSATARGQRRLCGRALAGLVRGLSADCAAS